MNEPFIKIDLHGMRIYEAEKTLEKAVASAGPGTYRIQVIHGYNRGTGLRDMIYDSFRYNEKVKRIIPGENPGITELVLRELY